MRLTHPLTRSGKITLSGPSKIDPRIGKADALMQLCVEAGLGRRNVWGEEALELLEKVSSIIEPCSNPDFAFEDSGAVEGVSRRQVFPASEHKLKPARHLRDRPTEFPPHDDVTAHCPELSAVTVSNGYVCDIAQGPVILASDGRTVLKDVGSRYSRMISYYDFDLAASVASARHIDGTAILICDDTRPLNFSHWLSDWLPRLALLGNRTAAKDVFVVVSPLIASFQKDTLNLCGFDDEQIVELHEYEAIRARTLLVPSDIRLPPHPGHRGAPWAYSYLRATVGLGSVVRSQPAPARSKIYVSRRDASGRRIVNDDAFASFLQTFGYTRIVPGEIALQDQVAAFAGAEKVVGIHGAAMANLYFSPYRTGVIEVFPKTFGSPAFYIVAEGLDCNYATYVCDEIVPNDRTQTDDMVIDIDDFSARCSHLL